MKNKKATAVSWVFQLAAVVVFYWGELLCGRGLADGVNIAVSG